MNASAARAAIDRALDFVAGRQLPHGEIRVDRGDEPGLDATTFESSPYGTTYALYALGFASSPAVGGVAARALDFLGREMEPPGLWRYYSSHNPKTLPPDVDDTACAAFALRRTHDEIRLGLHLRLLFANRDALGRFKTFFTDGANPLDSVVNANAVFYLGERDETRGACTFLREVVAEGREREASLYGVDDLSFYYVLSRAYFQAVPSLAPCREPVLERIAARRRDDGSYGDELATALAVATLHNFAGAEPGELAGSVRFLLSRQRPDGSWPRATFYLDFDRGYYGSEELTTAFAVEAIARTAAA